MSGASIVKLLPFELLYRLCRKEATEWGGDVVSARRLALTCRTLRCAVGDAHHVLRRYIDLVSRAHQSILDVIVARYTDAVARHPRQFITMLIHRTAAADADQEAALACQCLAAMEHAIRNAGDSGMDDVRHDHVRTQSVKFIKQLDEQCWAGTAVWVGRTRTAVTLLLEESKSDRRLRIHVNPSTPLEPWIARAMFDAFLSTRIQYNGAILITQQLGALRQYARDINLYGVVTALSP